MLLAERDVMAAPGHEAGVVLLSRRRHVENRQVDNGVTEHDVHVRSVASGANHRRWFVGAAPGPRLQPARRRAISAIKTGPSFSALAARSRGVSDATACRRQ